MSCDALFQLGMGPDLPDATQTEDHPRMPPAGARNANLRAHRVGAAAHAGASMPLSAHRLRGNSAKALIARA
jgi:hypothetical protein